MGIFDKRVSYKPFEYPEVMEFVEAINRSFWVHSEVDFTADVQDFNTSLTEKDRIIVRRSLTGIAQTEIGVKTFWGDLYKHFPKPELNGLGSTLAENEFRHSEAYSRLITVLGMEDDFLEIENIPVFNDRLRLIEENLGKNFDIIDKLLYFTIVIENASLFSQFANILAFTRFNGRLKNIANIIAWTSVDEDIHANAGIYLINKIREEGYINEGKILFLREMVVKYMDHESNLLDWVYEYGEPDEFKKDDMLNFMKYRIDNALSRMGIQKVFNISSEQYKSMKWFDEEIYANALDDFFAKRPVDYTKHDKSITGNDLF